MAKIIKISDDVFGGLHPNGIKKGYETNLLSGEDLKLPVIGERYDFGLLSTSIVTSLVSANKKGFTFKTKNSTYRVEY